MELLPAYLMLYGPAVLVASAPGIIALRRGRLRLGLALIVGAFLVTVLLSEYLDRREAEQLTADGQVADSLAFLFRPWMHAILYAGLGGVALAVANIIVPAPGENAKRG